jgi:general stress protein 26
MISDAEFKQRFWKALDDSPFVMLAVEGADGGHSQPMTAQLHDGFDDAVFFFTSAENPFARAAGEGRRALIHYSAKGHDLFAAVHGTLAIDRDEATIDALYSPVVAAWYEEGREDPKLTLLRLDLGRAQIWEAGTGSFLKEMASLLWRDTANAEAMKHQTETSFAQD